MTTPVSGYIFESMYESRAMAFNYFNQGYLSQIKRVSCGSVVVYMLIDSDDTEMKCLCVLLNETYKPYVTVFATQIEDIGY